MPAQRRLLGFLFHWVLPLAVLGCAVFAVGLLGSKSKAKRKKSPPRVSIPVDVVSAKPHLGDLTICASGVVVPFREVALATEVSGRVTWKSDALLPGRFVNQTDELLKIESDDYKLNVSRFQQQLEKAEADLAATEIDKQNAQRLIDLAKELLTLRTRELQRVEKLRDRQVTNDSEFDAARKAVVEAKQSLTTQENLLRVLDAKSRGLAADKQLASIGLDKAKLDLERTTIRAPFSGVVITHLAEANAHLQAGDPIATIEDTSKVEVRCSLRKEDLEFLPKIKAKGDSTDPAAAYRLPPIPVTVKYTRAGCAYRWQGVLSRQDGLGMDQRTRTMPVRIRIDKPLNCEVSEYDSAQPIALVRGMFVQVDLHCPVDRPLLAVPEETIRPGKTIWIMRDNKLHITPIQIARIENGVAYVDARGGQLSRQHAIIRSPVPGAKEGLAVTAKTNKARKKGKPTRKDAGDAQVDRDKAKRFYRGDHTQLASEESKP